MTKFGGYDMVNSWYQEGYESCYHTGFIAKTYRLVYRFMERPHRSSGNSRILEVGAGNGSYRKYAEPRYREYIELDIRQINSGDLPKGVKRFQGDATKLQIFPNRSFDRLVATCVLVHLEEPMAALREWRRVVRPGGSLTIYVPPEAGWLVRAVRRLIMWRKPAKMGFDGRRIASLEHRYSYFHLDALVREVFSSDQIVRRTFPFPFFEFDFALFHIYEIRLAD